MDNLYSFIPGLDKKVSRLIYGTATPAMLRGEDCCPQLEEAFKLGINTFDTARNYGLSELSLGRWLTEADKFDEVVIISKCAHPDDNGKRVSEKAIREDLNKSLECLGVNKIDVYLLHRDDENVPVEEVVRIMNALIKEGKISVYGASNWTAQRIKAANKYALENHLVPMAVSSPNFSLAWQRQDPWGGGCVSLTGKDQVEQREFYQVSQLPVFAYSSLARGFFSGKFLSSEIKKAQAVLDPVALKAYDCQENYERLKRTEIIAKRHQVTVGQVALKWIFTQGMNVFSIVSMGSEARIKDNLKALTLSLNEKEVKYLNLEVEKCE